MDASQEYTFITGSAGELAKTKDFATAEIVTVNGIDADHPANIEEKLRYLSTETSVRKQQVEAQSFRFQGGNIPNTANTQWRTLG